MALDVPGVITIRELIRLRVREEVARYNAQPTQRFNGLVRPADAEEDLNGYRMRRPTGSTGNVRRTLRLRPSGATASWFWSGTGRSRTSMRSYPWTMPPMWRSSASCRWGVASSGGCAGPASLYSAQRGPRPERPDSRSAGGPPRQGGGPARPPNHGRRLVGRVGRTGHGCPGWSAGGGRWCPRWTTKRPSPWR
jgi:hypothetical protein